jgi:hypothetical protein
VANCAIVYTFVINLDDLIMSMVAFNIIPLALPLLNSSTWSAWALEDLVGLGA